MLCELDMTISSMMVVDNCIKYLWTYLLVKPGLCI